MNSSKLLLTVGLLAGFAFPLVAADSAPSTVEVVYVDQDKFTDVKDRYGANERANPGYLRELKSHVERTAARRLNEGQKLTITITDIDMAGDFEPWRSPQFQDVRIVKDIYPPRVNLSFRLTDAAGAVIAEGERELRDLSFNMRAPTVPTNDPLRHEKALLDDWLRKELRTAKKS
ncbi:MAG TPA: DUF3016 domain-containing protein [Candidatus Synoicihabitans sp.]|nr:DUF3016 domain-containing protein [Candidatus Synoicihabitans sp.]